MSKKLSKEEYKAKKEARAKEAKMSNEFKNNSKHVFNPINYRRYTFKGANNLESKIIKKLWPWAI